MKLNEILNSIEYEVLQGEDKIDIKSITCDSRRVKPNSLFICMKGILADGHDYAKQAVDDGAVALIVEDIISEIIGNIAIVKIKDIRKKLSRVSYNFFKLGNKTFKLLGVTGAYGKTSLLDLLSAMAIKLTNSFKVIDNDINFSQRLVGDICRFANTPIELGELLNDFGNDNIDEVFMQIPLPSITQHYYEGLQFDIGVFTNFLNDDTYNKSHKKKINSITKFLEKCKTLIINTDDISAQKILSHLDGKNIIKYGIYNEADICAKDVVITSKGTVFTLKIYNFEREIAIKSIAVFNIYNVLASICVYISLGITIDQVMNQLSSIGCNEKIFQTIISDNGYSIVVDNAYSPIRFKNFLTSLRKVQLSRIITVFGCGGDRDNKKRQKMGKIAGQYSDFCVITSDNPRTENPTNIMAQIEDGIRETSCPYVMLEDRKTAIEFAIHQAIDGDTIVIAGKGHERYQIFENKVLYFNDFDIALEYDTRKSDVRKNTF